MRLSPSISDSRELRLSTQGYFPPASTCSFPFQSHIPKNTWLECLNASERGDFVIFFSIKRQSDRQVSPDPFDFGDPYNVRFFTLTEPEASQRPELLLGYYRYYRYLQYSQISRFIMILIGHVHITLYDI